MTATEPNVNDAGRYSTKEAYMSLEVSRSQFARYVRAGMIACCFRRTQLDRMGNPRKFFTGRQIKMLWRKL